MGDTGPCGPCSEIFFDHGDKIPGGPPGSVDADGDRFIEIWNLVFMQYEQVTKDERVSLPKPSIDTGMGLERVAAVLQGTHDNYETDLFRALIANIQEMAVRVGAPPDDSTSDELLRAIHQTGNLRVARRVIADHLRASSFLIADGVLPSNEGRGYVLRRIMRRAMRYAHQLGCKEPLMHLLVPELVRQMGSAYQELVQAQLLITETLELEETRFKRTLERGLGILNQEVEELDEGATFSGSTAFKLYDTYGFPLDLTQDALRPRGISVDTAAFDAAMKAQRDEARKAWRGSGEAKTETIWFEIRERAGASEFLGYDTETAEAIVRALVVDGKEVSTLTKGQRGAIVLNQTPFYGESGGQTGDHGAIRTAEGGVFRVTDTQKRVGDLIVHSGMVEEGTIRMAAAAELIVDHARRTGNRLHHSATHLLHEALRLTLGAHVAQKGSLVEPNRLRFDISHNKPVSRDEIRQVETIANEMVLQNDAVTTRLMSVDAARAEGAMALFGEKYGDEVRVVSMGRNAHGAGRPIYSLELCGGTHVARTGDIGLIKVVSESATAAGVRRIEALAGPAARAYFEEQDARVQAAAALLKASPAEMIARVEALVDERRKLERELAEAKKALALGGGAATGDDGITQVNGIKLMARVLKGIDPKDMKGLVDDGKIRLGSGIVALIGINDEGRASASVGVTSDLVSRYNAVDLVKLAAAELGGKGGGGRPDLAQAGGPDATKAEEALAAIRAAIAG